MLLAALFLVSDAHKFEDAQETVPVEVLTDSQFNQVMKGDKAAKQIKAPRVDRVADVAEHKPHPPLAEAKKDAPTPPPSLRRLPDPGDDNTPEPPKPPKRAAESPPPAPTPAPPPRPAPEKAEKPAPTPPAKPKAAAPQPEKAEPDEAEVVKPKPPVRPKPEAKETPTPPKPDKPVKETPKESPKPPEKPKQETRLRTDDVAKLLRESKEAEAAEGEKADKPQKAVKPKSGDEQAPKTKFDAASISDMLSREAPQRRASAGKEMNHTASLGAPAGAAQKMSASLQGRIDSYTVEHYGRCWRAALSMNALTYVPRVEFRLTRDGALEGAPRLLNPSPIPVERSRGEQALAAVRRCSPMPIPADFAPYYDYWRVTELDMKEDM